MYLPIGETFSVRADSIIGIFDLDNATWSRHTRQFLRQAEEQGQVIAATEDLPRAFVLTREFSMDRVYLTQVSSGTLEKRLTGEKRRK